MRVRPSPASPLRTWSGQELGARFGRFAGPEAVLGGLDCFRSRAEICRRNSSFSSRRKPRRHAGRCASAWRTHWRRGRRPRRAARRARAQAAERICRRDCKHRATEPGGQSGFGLIFLFHRERRSDSLRQGREHRRVGRQRPRRLLAPTMALAVALKPRAVAAEGGAEDSLRARYGRSARIRSTSKGSFALRIAPAMLRSAWSRSRLK